MATQPLLVDTDVFSWIAREQEQAEPFRPIISGRLLALSFATVGELYFGAAKAGWGQRRLADLESALGRYTVLPGTREIARCCGDIKAQFRDQLDERDMWTASTALAHGVPIVTNNLRHFEPMSERFGFGIEHPSYRAED